ncbi:chromosome partitioning protein ParA [Andreesenia angusta]|uniref:Chromosome partitioning protein ParA n=1 Tax=Andreesenia angusta TaxID=39480 RepID=A0A1S1V8K3_9FIRM|nr:ParA family protein [Andreesenia angusta]OHW62922.1 chromosome partitioning protein ParA [Andreesenia angusta]
MKTISIINLKGGVAKTISSVNIAHILATVHGKKVLIIDNDKQGNTSKFFGACGENIYKSMADILTEKDIKISEAIYKTKYENLDIIPATMALLKANLDVMLDMSRPQQTRLSKALYQIEDVYDYCIIDNAPDINISVINALVTSDDVLIPIKVDKFAFDGLDLLVEQIENVREINPNIKLQACFLTMYQKNNVNTQGDEWIRAQPDYPMLDSKIRKTVKVDESTFAQKPLLEYAKNCTATKDYLELVKEILEES